MQDMKMTDGVCSSRRITSIFDIFRIGVVTSYGEGMLNLLNLFSLKRLPLLSQFHIVLFYVLLFHVLHCHVLQFHVLSFSPTFSCPAFSAPP